MTQKENPNRIERTRGEIERSLPGFEAGINKDYYLLLEQAAATIAKTQSERKPWPLRRYAERMFGFWFKRLNEYVVEIGGSQNLGDVAVLDGVLTTAARHEEKGVKYLQIHREGDENEAETSDMLLLLEKIDPPGAKPTVITSVFLARGVQVDHKITFTNRQIVKWERNGEPVYEAPPGFVPPPLDIIDPSM